MVYIEEQLTHPNLKLHQSPEYHLNLAIYLKTKMCVGPQASCRRNVKSHSYRQASDPSLSVSWASPLSPLAALGPSSLGRVRKPRHSDRVNLKEMN